MRVVPSLFCRLALVDFGEGGFVVPCTPRDPPTLIVFLFNLLEKLVKDLFFQMLSPGMLISVRRSTSGRCEEEVDRELRVVPGCTEESLSQIFRYFVSFTLTLSITFMPSFQLPLCNLSLLRLTFT